VLKYNRVISKLSTLSITTVSKW